MKAGAFVLFLAVSSIDCRKILTINKNANIDFINMEIGGGSRPINTPVQQPAPIKPQTSELPKPGPAQPPSSPVTPPTAKPVVAAPTVPPTPAKPTQPKPTQSIHSQVDLKPVPAKPGSTNGVTTPGYGNVKQLVNFYDKHGNASVIRPYSYSQAVKNG